MSAKQADPMKKFFVMATSVLAVTTICLSIAVARLAEDTGSASTSQTVNSGSSGLDNVDTVVTCSNSTTIITNTITTIPSTPLSASLFPGENICAGTKVNLPEIECYINMIGNDSENVTGTKLVNDAFALGTGEQSGANVTKGYNGKYPTSAEPITKSYYEEGLCPVNVHWHLGTEHYSLGEYDEDGSSPSKDHDHESDHRALAGDARAGYKCHHYDDTKPKFTKEYDWKFCENMHVGETYEVHWPHSNMGACGTPNQYQTPFYDGVFCNFATTFGGALAGAKIGVQGQVFTIVNDEDYYYPDLIDGMIVDGEFGTDVAKYTGSTTGTKRDNEMCSQYTGVTWQVDRKCHMISASSFDKMCADMKAKRDDMSGDFYPHGSRELVDDALAADNHATRKLRIN